MGVIQSGMDYQSRAMSGMIRHSAQEQDIARANEELEARESAQKKSNQATMTVAGATAGWAIGAEIGSVGGPYGAAAGAVVGFLFGSLM